MKFNVKLKSVEDIQRLRAKMSTIQLQLLEFQAIEIRRLANILIVEKIQSRMRAANFSKKIIDNTYLDNIEFVTRNRVKLFFRSEYFSETGFDVALAREKGTRKHPIKPVKKKVLKWIVAGVAFFSPGHWVSGIMSLYIIRDTVKEMRPQLQEEFTKSMTDWFRRNLEGIASVEE